jgi:hypothetical protein
MGVTGGLWRMKKRSFLTQGLEIIVSSSPNVLIAFTKISWMSCRIMLAKASRKISSSILTLSWLRDKDLSFSHIDIYHGFKFCLESLGNDVDFDQLEEPDP